MEGGLAHYHACRCKTLKFPRLEQALAEFSVKIVDGESGGNILNYNGEQLSTCVFSAIGEDKSKDVVQCIENFERLTSKYEKIAATLSTEEKPGAWSISFSTECWSYAPRPPPAPAKSLEDLTPEIRNLVGRLRNLFEKIDIDIGHINVGFAYLSRVIDPSQVFSSQELIEKAERGQLSFRLRSMHMLYLLAKSNQLSPETFRRLQLLSSVDPEIDIREAALRVLKQKNSEA
jgi:hypothetical protein